MDKVKVINQKITEHYCMYHGDCVEVVRGIPNDSVGFSIFSPPFASLFTYSNSARDMGNCRDDEEFVTHFSFLVQELFRVMMPGRSAAIHCMNYPCTIQREGYIGLKDLRGISSERFNRLDLSIMRKFVYGRIP